MSYCSLPSLSRSVGCEPTLDDINRLREEALGYDGRIKFIFLKEVRRMEERYHQMKEMDSK